MAHFTQAPSLWRNRAYLLLWGGQVVSNVGSGVSQIAYPLLILAITHSVVQAALISAVRSLAYVLFMLPVGALLDRWNRKLVMIVSDTGRALMLASIVLAFAWGHLTILQLYITGFLEVSLSTFFDIAELSCLPHVVAKEQLPEALGRTQATYGIMNLLSPPLGGLLFTLRPLLPFLVDALSYVVSVCSLLFIHIPFQEQRDVLVVRNLAFEIGQGLRWLWHQPLLRSMAHSDRWQCLFWGGSDIDCDCHSATTAYFSDNHRLYFWHWWRWKYCWCIACKSRTKTLEFRTNNCGSFVVVYAVLVASRGFAIPTFSWLDRCHARFH